MKYLLFALVVFALCTITNLLRDEQSTLDDIASSLRNTYALQRARFDIEHPGYKWSDGVKYAP